MSKDSVSQLWEWRLFDAEVVVAAHLRKNFEVQFSLLEPKSLSCRSLSVSSPGMYRVPQASTIESKDLLFFRLEEPVVSSLYAAILSATGTPLRLLECLVSSLIRLILTSSDEESVATSTTNAARALLSLVHQRHVDILRDAVGKIVEDEESEHEGDDQRLKKKERKTKADELIISFSVVSFLSVCHYIYKLRTFSESSMGSKY